MSNANTERGGVVSSYLAVLTALLERMGDHIDAGRLPEGRTLAGECGTVIRAVERHLDDPDAALDAEHARRFTAQLRAWYRAAQQGSGPAGA